MKGQHELSNASNKNVPHAEDEGVRLDHLPLAVEVKFASLLLGLVQSLQVRGDVRCGKAHPVILENDESMIK